MNVYLILLVVLCNITCLRASRMLVSLYAIDLGAEQYVIGLVIALYALRRMGGWVRTVNFCKTLSAVLT